MKLKYLLFSLAAVLLSASAAHAVNIATWTFETSQPGVVTLPASPGAGVYLTNITAEVGTGTASGLHAGASTYSSPVGNGSSHSFSSTAWAVGDFYQFAVSTLGLSGIIVTYDQTSSGTGPGQFYLAYSTDGVTFNVALARTNTVLANASPNPTWSGTVASGIYTVSYDLSSISALNNQTVVYLRLVDASTLSANGGTVAGAGTCRVDNFSVSTPTPPAIFGVIPPTFTTNAGNTVSLTVSNSAGSAPLTYFWFKETGTTTNLIIDATNATLTLSNVLAADTANYQVVVSNSTMLNATSDIVPLTIIDPAFNRQPIGYAILTNGLAKLIASAAGTAISYQWYFCASTFDNTQLTGPVSNGTLPSGAVVSGATTDGLAITNFTPTTPTNYVLVVTGTYGSVTSSVASLRFASASGSGWSFNDKFDPISPAPDEGFGVATGTNADTFVQPTRDANDLTSGVNTAWGTQNYPAATSSNKQAGVRFDVPTTGMKNIKMNFDLRGTSTASKYQRVQFTTNGIDFVDYPASQRIEAVQINTYNTFNYDFTGFPGVRNNPNFGVRIVTEFESTALYNNTNDATYIGISAGYSPSGTLSYDLVGIGGDGIVGNNQPPTISAIPALSVGDMVGTNLHFTVTDDTSPVGLIGVTAQSLDPSTPLTLNAVNSGGNVTLTISPTLGISTPINVPVLVTALDTNLDSTVTWFMLTITPANAAAVYTGLINTNMLTNSTITIPFTLIDDHTPATSLTPSVTSSNSLLVPNDVSHLSLGGSGTNRTLIITPAANQSGSAPLVLSVTDGGSLVSTKTLYVQVRPNTNVMLIDNFDYDTAGAIIDVSGSLWANHSGTLRQLQVGSGVATINNNANSEDINAPLIGAPYATNEANNITLYATYTLHYTTLPNGTNGSYITHFKDNTTFGFFGRIYASTNQAAPGSYRLGIGNSTVSSSTNAQLAMDLLPNVDYTVVARIRMTNGFCTLWVNPTSELSTGVTDTTVVTNLTPVYQYAFRESTGGGIANVDNLKVGTSFAGVTGLVSTPPTPPAPGITGISVGGPGNTNIIITGTNNNGTTAGNFVVLVSTNIAQPLSNWTALSTQAFNPDGTLNFTNGIGTDPNRFYILQALP